MNSQKIQRLVRRIFSDEATGARFTADPESVLSQYRLSEDEKNAVLLTHSKMGLVGSGSTRLEAAIGPLSHWA